MPHNFFKKVNKTVRSFSAGFGRGQSESNKRISGRVKKVLGGPARVRKEKLKRHEKMQNQLRRDAGMPEFKRRVRKSK